MVRLCLTISSFVLTIQLRGQWFQIYSVLMRQSCTILEKNKILIIFILATVIFTYGYEGIISSLLTVPPPVIVFRTLRDLIVNNYKILGVYERKDGKYSELDAVFKQENITASVSSSIVANSSRWMDYYLTALLAQCNTTWTLSKYSEDTHVRNIGLRFPGIKCHSAKHTRKIYYTNYFFFGHSKEALSKISRTWMESGLLSMIDDLAHYIIGTLQQTKVIIIHIRAE